MEPQDFDKAREEASNTGFPADPFSVMGEAGASMHEMYESWMRAGFSAEQSLYLVGCGLTGNPGRPPSGD